MTSEKTGRPDILGRVRRMSIDMDVFFTGIRFFRVADGNDVDEERNEHTDQGVEDTVEGEVRDAGIGTVCDGDTQKCDTGDVGQGAFPHEVGQKDQGRDRKEFSQVAFFLQDGGERIFLDGFRDIHQRQDTERYQQILQHREPENAEFADDEQDGHAGQTADQRADRPVHADAERAFDFRLQTNDRGDTGIERNAGSDIEEFVNQATDEDRECRLDNQFSHKPKISDCYFQSTGMQV